MWTTSVSLLFIIFNALPHILLQGVGGDGEGSTLQLVQILFRHGERNPLASYPNDPHQDESNWPGGYRQLTTTGKRQLYEFGEYLRHRYDGYLNKSYNVKDTIVWSSDNDRTIMSALAAMAGLYPPIPDEDVWNPVENFQIVPVHTLSTTVDRILNTERDSCRNFNSVLKNFIKTSKYMRDLNRDSKNLLKYLSTNSGLKIGFVNDLVYKLHDTLFIQESRNMTIPIWAKPLMEPDSEFKKVVQKCYTAFSMTPELRRLYSGELVKELLGNMKAKLDGGSNRRLIMYSGHDLTITNLMNTMGIYTNEIPPYAASLLFELHKNQDENGKYTVKILYRDEPSQDPRELNVPDCGVPCELGKLEELMASSISSNWDEECKGILATPTVAPIINAGFRLSSMSLILSLGWGMLILNEFGVIINGIGIVS